MHVCSTFKNIFRLCLCQQKLSGLFGVRLLVVVIQVNCAAIFAVLGDLEPFSKGITPLKSE